MEIIDAILMMLWSICALLLLIKKLNKPEGFIKHIKGLLSLTCVVSLVCLWFIKPSWWLVWMSILTIRPLPDAVAYVIYLALCFVRRVKCHAKG